MFEQHFFSKFWAKFFDQILDQHFRLILGQQLLTKFGKKFYHNLGLNNLTKFWAKHMDKVKYQNF